MKQDLKLSTHQENYIETIYKLCQDHGHAHTKAIADSLGIRMPSVTEALGLLSEKGLINYEVRKTITMTELGEKIAQDLDHRHDVLKGFYENILGLSHKKANQIACKVEHVVDSDFADRLAEFHNFLKEELPQECQEKINAFKDRFA